MDGEILNEQIMVGFRGQLPQRGTTAALVRLP